MTDMFQTQSIQAFLDTLASKEATPGGGSVAALSGAMAAGLLCMVCAITLNKPQSEEDTEALNAIWLQAEDIRQTLQGLAAEDIEIFQRLSAAYKLPRTTDADAASRQAAIQNVTRQATDIPLRTAHAATALLPLCTTLAHRCNRLLVSDVGIAATLARASTQSSLLNIEINLASLHDQDYVRDVRTQIEDLTVGLAEETKGILELVLERIKQ